MEFKYSKKHFVFFTIFVCLCSLAAFINSVKHYPIWWWFMPKERQLCDGYHSNINQPGANLQCYYIRRFFLYVYKVEELHTNPDVISIHQFINHLNDYDWLIKYTRDNSQPSPVYTLLTNTEAEKTLMRVLDFRTSHSLGLGSLYLNSLFQNADRAAGLSNKNLDGGGVDVVWYEKFGHIIPHHDVYPNSDTIKGGRRFATLIFYLNEPEQGGATIFPRLKLAVRPIAGDAILFYNTYVDNEPDPLLSHAGCPVWKGEKFIGTFWFRQFQQEFKKPCPLNGQRFQFS